MQNLYFQYYVASFLCHCVCALWYELGERSLLVGTGRPTANTPSVDEVAGIVTDLAMEDRNVRDSIQQFGKRIWYIERDVSELADNWITRLQEEATSLVNDQVWENFLFNIQYLYFAFLCQVVHKYCNLAKQIDSQLKTLSEHIAAYSQLLEITNKIEAELDLVENDLGVSQKKIKLLNDRKSRFSKELALSWQTSVFNS
ncbi:MAG: hypothetical protein KJ069_06440 [Anaerolineae bacterium]|nr:hypothetical protein [Anaerolineae bacterium]